MFAVKPILMLLPHDSNRNITSTGMGLELLLQHMEVI